jgi:hypothetical protein
MSGGLFRDERDALQDRFSDAWDADAYPVVYENADVQDMPQGVPWVRFFVKPGQGNPAALGGQFHRWAGVVLVQCFAQVGADASLAHLVADLVADVFLSSGRGVQFTTSGGSRITCDTPSVSVFGPEGHGYYQVNVQIPYRRDAALT